MKITLFSSNQPRHLNLARELAKIADEVFFISEVKSIIPEKTANFSDKSEVMQRYFAKVISAEKKVFGDIDFLPNNIHQLAIKAGDLNLLTDRQLRDALSSDIYIVFGASYIKGWLVDFLIANQAFNIHMGISPYYRGSSCNFWALYDYNPAYVGATIHMLSKGLDSGDMLFHCLPNLIEKDSVFDFTMRSVSAAHFGLCQSIKNQTILSMNRTKQDRSLELRYTRDSEFNEKIAEEFLKREYSIDQNNFEYANIINPIFY